MVDIARGSLEINTMDGKHLYINGESFTVSSCLFCSVLGLRELNQWPSDGD